MLPGTLVAQFLVMPTLKVCSCHFMFASCCGWRKPHAVQGFVLGPLKDGRFSTASLDGTVQHLATPCGPSWVDSLTAVESAAWQFLAEFYEFLYRLAKTGMKWHELDHVCMDLEGEDNGRKWGKQRREQLRDAFFFQSRTTLMRCVSSGMFNCFARKTIVGDVVKTIT